MRFERSRRWYRWLLERLCRADPETCDELEEVFLLHLEDGVERWGRVGAVPVWVRSAADLLVLAGKSRSAKRLAAETKHRSGTSKETMSNLLMDLRVALRGLARTPGFTVVVIITLGLGIGANTAIFSVVNGVLLRPLPYEDSEELAFVWGRMAETSVERAPFSGPDIADFRERSESFEGFAGVFATNTTLTGDFEAEHTRLGWTTVNFFSLLGVEAELGRGFLPEDRMDIDQSVFFDPSLTPPPAPALISHELWQRKFGSSTDAIGKSIWVNGQALHIIGVIPAGFQLYLPADASLPRDIEVWTPIPTALDAGARDAQWLTVVGRKRDGVGWTEAQAEMDRIAAQLRSEHQFHQNVGMNVLVTPVQQDVVRHVRPVLIALLGAVGFVLLVACANVANLLLIRAQAREREIAIRSALGGGRTRIMGQLLTETAVLAVAGGLVGLMVASSGIDLLMVLSPANLPRAEAVGVDAWVLAAAVGATFASIVLAGGLPALKASKPDLAGSLRDRSGKFDRDSHRARDGLVVAEVALSLVLLIGAGLMLRTFASLQRVEPGFESENVLTAAVAPPFFKYRTSEQRVRFFQDVTDQLETLPGVEQVGGVAALPLAGGGQLWFGPYALSEDPEEWSRNEVDYRPVLPGYFEVMTTRLLSGRSLDRSDNEPDARPVVVIDEVMAETAWPGREAVGEQILVMRPGGTGTGFDRFWAEVVGVVEHIRYDDIREDGRGTIYFPHRDWNFGEMAVTVLTRVDPTSLIDEVRRAVLAVDPEVTPATVRPLDAYVGDALAPTRFALILIGAFGAVALTLASIGLYGVISYSVKQRSHEIGIRLAFGADASRILRLVLSKGLTLAGLGLLIGIAGALFLTQALSSLVFGVSPTDPLTFVGVSALLLGVSVLACYVPALRATKVDPIMTLRAE